MDSSTPGFSSHQPSVKNARITESCTSQSRFHKTVCLYDWWLTKSQADSGGNRLAVAGVSSRENEAKRIFVSAPITSRYNDFLLETADGIYVIIRGFINKAQTTENGFPYEVFNHFVFGFPPHWERFAITCFEWDSTGVACSDNSAFDGSDINPGSRTCDGLTKSSSPGSPVNSLDKNMPQHETSEGSRTRRNARYQTQPSVSNSPVISKNEQMPKSEALVNLKGTKRGNLLHATLRSTNSLQYSSGHVASSITQKRPCKSKNELPKLLMDHDSSIIKVCEGISDAGRCHSCNGVNFTSPRSLRHRKNWTTEESPVGLIDIDSSHKSKVLVKNKSNAKACAKTTSKIKNNTHASPTVCCRNQVTPMVSSESSYKKSRSGRLLLPPLEFWRNELPVYDMDRKIIGIKDGPSMVSVSPPSSRGAGSFGDGRGAVLDKGKSSAK